MIKLIPAEQTYPIRKFVLRKNMPQESCKFSGDLDQGTFHLGYFFENELVGILTLMKSQEIGVYQLRGMAILENFQGKNIGKKLVEEAENLLKNKNISEIGLNARQIAIPFYEKCGYSKQGDFFEIKPIGTHIKMTKVF